MRNRRTVVIALAVCAVFLTSQFACGALVNTVNGRNLLPSGGPAGEEPLWEVFNNDPPLHNAGSQFPLVFSGPKIGMVGDQLLNAIFKPKSTPGPVATMVVEWAGNANRFGIYDYNPNGAPQHYLELFSGSDAAKARSQVVWSLGVNPGEVIVQAQEWVSGAWQNYGAAQTWMGNEFGFYLDGPDAGSLNRLMHSEDQWNTNGVAQALIFSPKKPNPDGSPQQQLDVDRNGALGNFVDDGPFVYNSDVIIGWEDLDRVRDGSVDHDFNDMVVLVRGVETEAPPASIPEPASMLVWAGVAGLGAAGAMARRKRRAPWSEENRQAIFEVIQSGR